MSRIFLYAHGGSGNHGCEAIVRSTVHMLSRTDVCLISSCTEEDYAYGLGDICKLMSDRSNCLPKMSLDFLKAYLALKLKKDFVPMDKLWYKASFANIHEGDVALSIGGDNYCYADVNKYVMLHDILKDRKAKTILWGCSVEPEVAICPDIARDLARYDLITARESVSYNALKTLNPNTCLVADSAFILETQKCVLPQGFVPGNTVGLNLSPMAMRAEKHLGISIENYRTLIQHITENTDMQIALIPHVVWTDNDDRIPLRQLYEEFKASGRVVMVEDHNCQELKYLISKCRFFIGSRTHATIAAYSSCVPTLVMGYSVKSRGIARDLFGAEEGYVLPVQQLAEPNQLTDAFINLWEQQDEIRRHLEKIMPAYIERAKNAKKVVEQAFNI